MVTMQENWLRQKEELKAWAAAQGGSTDLHKVLMMLMMMSMMMIMMMMMMASAAKNEPMISGGHNPCGVALWLN